MWVTRLMKWYGWPGQPRRSACLVEVGVHRAERLGRLAPRAGDHRLPVEREAVAIGGHHDVGVGGSDGTLGELGHRRERPAGNEFDADPVRVEGGLAVDEAEDVADDGRVRPVPDLFDVDLVDHALGSRVDLAAALQFDRVVRHRLESPAVGTHRVAERSQVERHGLDAGLDHEVAGHARVVLEVPVEEPRVVGDRRLAAHEAATPRTTPRVEVGDLVDEQLVARLDLRRAGVRLGPLEAGPEAIEGPSLAERPDLVAVERVLRARRRPVGRRERRRAGRSGPIRASTRHRWASRSSSLREEPGLPVAHGQAPPPGDHAVVLEEEQPDVAVLGVPGDADLVLERVADRRGGRRGTRSCSRAAGRTLAAVEQVDPHVADQHQVGLTGLDHEAGRHVAAVEVPGVAPDVGLGPDRAAYRGRRARRRARSPGRRAAAAAPACGTAARSRPAVRTSGRTATRSVRTSGSRNWALSQVGPDGPPSASSALPTDSEPARRADDGRPERWDGAVVVERRGRCTRREYVERVDARRQEAFVHHRLLGDERVDGARSSR